MEENVLTVDVTADNSQYGWKYFDAESSPILKKRLKLKQSSCSLMN